MVVVVWRRKAGLSIYVYVCMWLEPSFLPSLPVVQDVRDEVEARDALREGHAGGQEALAEDVHHLCVCWCVV